MYNRHKCWKSWTVSHNSFFQRLYLLCVTHTFSKIQNFFRRGRRDFKLSFAGFGIDLSFLQTSEKLFSQFAPKSPFLAHFCRYLLILPKIGEFCDIVDDGIFTISISTNYIGMMCGMKVLRKVWVTFWAHSLAMSMHTRPHRYPHGRITKKSGKLILCLLCIKSGGSYGQNFFANISAHL